MKKALIAASVYGFLGSFERNDINILNEYVYDVTCATNMSNELKEFGDIGQLNSCNIKKYQIDFPRSPFSKNIFTAYKQLKKLLREQNFNLIHCHTPVASILIRLIAKKYCKPHTTVIYTAHGFHFYKGAPFINWLIYYPIEKFCSRFTDVLITINKEDYSFAINNMKAKKNYYIPGVGINTASFDNAQVDRLSKLKELGIPENSIVALSVGELNTNKNHETTIKALARCKNENIHYIIAGTGNLKGCLKELSVSLNVQNRVHLLGYRNDLSEIYNVCDMFIFPSKREGLSVSLMEAMASGLPCIVSNIRGNVDLIENAKGGYLVNCNEQGAFAHYMDKLSCDKVLRKQYGKYNKQTIKEFDTGNVSNIMRKIYKKEVN